MTRIDRIALLVSLAAFLAAAFVSARVFERMPHIEDEMAFAWQARVIERGRLSVPSPRVYPDSLAVPFVVDYHGQRFGKYPPGWPVVLALGELAGLRFLVNPLLTGMAVWLIYRLVKKALDEHTALLAAALAALSPFVWMNGGSLLSHPWSLLLALVFTVAWLDAFTQTNLSLPPRLARLLPAVAAGLSLGALALARPWTAVGVALPFAIHALVLLVRGGANRTRLLGVGLLAGAIAGLYFLWQYALTGDPLLNPYTLVWPYDTVGFGPGHGLHPGGFQPANAWINTKFSLFAANTDLFGWPKISWLFMPFGLWAVRKNGRAWLVASLAPAMIAIYALYWMPSWLLGPRYYYEALAAPLLLTAAGIRWLAGSPARLASAALKAPKIWLPRLRFGLAVLLAGLLVAANAWFYLPMRLGGLNGLYGISAACLRPFMGQNARKAVPALVFVHVTGKWTQYGCLEDLNSPYLDSDFVVVVSQGAEINPTIAAEYPGRTVLHYYPNLPRLLDAPREPAQPPTGKPPAE